MNEPFTIEVDGIVSGPPGNALRLMVELIEDFPQSNDYFRQCWHNPPTEQELDRFVRTGRL